MRFLLALAPAVLALTIAASPGSSPASTPMSAPTAVDRIQHIIVIVEQNHTFDSYFGMYPGANGLASLADLPIDPRTGDPVLLKPYSDQLLAELLSTLAPGREPVSNGRGAAKAAYNDGAMDGFVGAQLKRGFDPVLSTIYYPEPQAQALWDIAGEFVLFDNYFSSVMGDSLPNMLYLVAGSSHGISQGTKATLAQLANEDIPTVFDLLQEAGISWKYYIGGLESLGRETILRGDYLDPIASTPPQLYWAPVLAMPRFLRDPSKSSRLTDQDEFFSDAARGELPMVSFVLPRPTDHPLTPPSVAHRRLLSLVNAVAKSPQWDQTATFIVWDEWGGFYDHVPPRQVDDLGLGFRVPALLVSPWAKRGYISSVSHDHTSVLSFIASRFDLPPLSQREIDANGFEDAFQFDGAPREPVVFGLASVPPAPVSTPSQNMLTLVIYLAAFAVVAASVAVLAKLRRT